MNILKETESSEKLSNGKIQDQFAKISKKFCDFAEMHNLQIKSLKCSQTSGTLHFKMLGQKPVRNNEGSICGDDRSFHGCGNSRTQRRKRRQALRDLTTSSAEETDSNSAFLGLSSSEISQNKKLKDNIGNGLQESATSSKPPAPKISTPTESSEQVDTTSIEKLKALMKVLKC